MLVIADTSPLNYLILIDAVELLPRLYKQIILPQAAWEELKDPGAPLAVSTWANALPSWVDLRTAPHVHDAERDLASLGDGEREAILLAELYRHQTEVLLLLDEELARKQAARRHLTTTGTLGILRSAAAHGWIDLPEFFRRLRQTNFRASDELLRRLLDEDAQRKQSGTSREGE